MLHLEESWADRHLVYPTQFHWEMSTWVNVISFERSNGVVTESMLESCALQLGLSIPSDYSKFLLQNGNGGICRIANMKSRI